MNRRSFATAAIAAALASGLPPAGKAQKARPRRVDIRGSRFRPERLEVRIGERVEFTNSDGTPHTATAIDGSWDTRDLSKGEAEVITVKAGMTRRYVCRYHPAMKAELVIVN